MTNTVKLIKFAIIYRVERGINIITIGAVKAVSHTTTYPNEQKHVIFSMPATFLREMPDNEIAHVVLFYFWAQLFLLVKLVHMNFKIAQQIKGIENETIYQRTDQVSRHGSRNFGIRGAN